MGIIQYLLDKVNGIKVKAENKKQFGHALALAVKDGKLTEDEIKSLESMKAEYGLTDSDIKSMRIAAYEAAYCCAKADGIITDEEEVELQKIQQYLGISDHEISRSKTELNRLRVINEIQNGNLPVQTVSNMVTQRGETVHWSEPGAILEERVVSRRYVGSSSGISFRIARGITYRVGASRGQLITDTAVVPVSYGNLVLTNKRVVFAGDKKSFSFKIDKILNLEFYRDGVQFNCATGKPRVVQLATPENVDIVGAVLSSTINSYAG